MVPGEGTIQKLRAGEPETRAIREALNSFGAILPAEPDAKTIHRLLDQFTRRPPALRKFQVCVGIRLCGQAQPAKIAARSEARSLFCSLTQLNCSSAEMAYGNRIVYVSSKPIRR